MCAAISKMSPLQAAVRVPLQRRRLVPSATAAADRRDASGLGLRVGFKVFVEFVLAAGAVTLPRSAALCDEFGLAALRADLDQQALAEVARADAEGIEVVDDWRAPGAKAARAAAWPSAQLLDGRGVRCCGRAGSGGSATALRQRKIDSVEAPVRDASRARTGSGSAAAGPAPRAAPRPVLRRSRSGSHLR